MSMRAASRAWPRNPVQFALEIKATSSLMFFKGKNRDLCVHHWVFIAKAKRFLILKRGGELLRSGFLLKASCEVLYKTCPLFIEEKLRPGTLL